MRADDLGPELTDEEMLHAYRMLRLLKAGRFRRLEIELHRRDKVLIISGTSTETIKCGPGEAIKTNW